MRLRTPEGDPAPTIMNRRAALSLFTAGYALAGASAQAQTITTSGEGLSQQEVTIPAANGYALPAFVARPVGQSRRAAVIVVNEIFGIHEYIKDVCRRLARQGYVAIAPDYFDRAGDPAPLTDIAEVRKIVEATHHDQVLEDTAAVRRWLGVQPFVKRNAVGITGFCWGGTVVWRAAALTPGLKAGVAWYGRLDAPAQPSFGTATISRWPVDLAGELKAPVLGIYAENDRGIPLTSVQAMRAALAAAGNPSRSEIIVYQGAEHGFHADYRAGYNRMAATEAWGRMLAWFESHGVS